jgi:hypothetical protein
MHEIHCHVCGGCISDPAKVSYRLASSGDVMARPHTKPCPCTPAIVYGPPAGYMSWPGLMIQADEAGQ